MELKAGYKQTEVGVIPEDWDAKSLREDILLLSGHHVLARYCNMQGDGIPYLTGPSDFPNGMIQQTKFTENPTTLCQKGDILVTVKGSGSGILIDADASYCISRQLMSIRVKKWEGRFLLYSLQQNASQIKAASTGVIPGLSRSDILNQKIPIPPNTSEQRSIASALSNVDALITALDRLIAKKRDIKHAAMQELLTGKKRLPGFASGNGYKQTEVGLIPEDWNSITIEGICDSEGLVRGPFGGALKKEFFVQEGFKVYEQKNAINHDADIGNYHINNEKFNELKRFEVKDGDFIVSCSGTIGKIFQIPIGSKPGIINQALLKIKIDGRVMLDKFFLNIFNWESFQKKVIDKQGGAMQNLVGMNIIRKISIPLPCLSEQHVIASVLSDMDAEIAALEIRRKKTNDLKQGMMQELLTGRIRLMQGGAA
jgi:type I restriction enzyme, S subunit